MIENIPHTLNIKTATKQQIRKADIEGLFGDKCIIIYLNARKRIWQSFISISVRKKKILL